MFNGVEWCYLQSTTMAVLWVGRWVHVCRPCFPLFLALELRLAAAGWLGGFGTPPPPLAGWLARH